MSVNEQGLADSLTFRLLRDPVIENNGYDPRSRYVETFWLPILGPSATWLLRWIAARLEVRPEGFGVHLGELATALGLGNMGLDKKNSPIRRTIYRCCNFDVARLVGNEMFVYSKLPPLRRNQLNRLPLSLQEMHRRLEGDPTWERPGYRAS